MQSPQPKVPTVIAVVDDQHAVLAEAQQQLKPHFERVETYANPADVLRAVLGGERYLAMLVDVLMEPVSGLDVLSLAREHDPHVPVLMMTAHACLDSAVSALQYGAVDFVTKPIVDWNSVVRSLHRAVVERELRQDNTHLLEQLHHRDQQLDFSVQLLRRVDAASQAMHTSQEPTKVLNVLLHEIAGTLEASRVSIMIRDQSNDRSAVHVAEGVDGAVIRAAMNRPWDGVAGLVLERQVPLVVNAPEDDPRSLTSRGSLQPYKGDRFMCIPITLGVHESGSQKVMGVLNVTDRKDDRVFDPIEVEFAVTLARQAAFALTGAALRRTLLKPDRAPYAGD